MIASSVEGGAVEADDVEIHPLYDVTTHLDALFSVPAYRQPANEHMERWRELGERLLAFGEAELATAYEMADEVLQARLEVQRRRRRRRRVARPASARPAS